MCVTESEVKQRGTRGEPPRFVLPEEAKSFTHDMASFLLEPGSKNCCEICFSRLRLCASRGYRAARYQRLRTRSRSLEEEDFRRERSGSRWMSVSKEVEDVDGREDMCLRGIIINKHGVA